MALLTMALLAVMDELGAKASRIAAVAVRRVEVQRSLRIRNLPKGTDSDMVSNFVQCLPQPRKTSRSKGT